jgi:hypothetical protein
MPNPREHDPESGYRFSGKIMPKQQPKAPPRFGFRLVTSNSARAQWLASRGSVYYVDNRLSLPQSRIAEKKGRLPGSTA